MHDWKFLLTSQIARGNWFLSHMDALSGMANAQILLNQDQSLKDAAMEILSQHKPMPLMSAVSDDFGVSESYDKLPQGSIAIFNISGTLLKHGTMCSYGMEEIANMMEAAAGHKNISGAFIQMDSGGGGVNSVPPVRAAINSFRAAGKKTLAWADAAYSAGYYDICGCDYLMAANKISSGFGSIGVMMSYMDVQEYYKKMGVVVKNIYAPESDEKNKSFELLLAGDDEALRNEELSPLAKAFQRDVIADRGSKLQYKDDPKIIAGKTYSAELSLANGLIDGIGTRNDGIQMLFDLISAGNYINNN